MNNIIQNNVEENPHINRQIDQPPPVWHHRFRPVHEVRAQAAGNRHAQPAPQFVARQIENAAQIVRDNRDVLRRAADGGNHRNRNSRNVRSFVRNRSREDLENSVRRSFQIRTAIEFDKREANIWDRIHKSINEASHRLPRAEKKSPPLLDGGPDVFIPNDAQICAMLRNENQKDAIWNARNILMNYNANENDLQNALNRLELHLKNSLAESEMIENTTNELIETLHRITTEVCELDALFNQMSSILIK